MAYKGTFNPKNPIKYVGNPNNIIELYDIDPKITKNNYKLYKGNTNNV